MSNNTWFNEAHYMAQKVAQMQTIGYKSQTGLNVPASGWNQELAYQEMDRWTNGKVTAFENFIACNTWNYNIGAYAEAGYDPVTLPMINVAPNPLFDIQIYLLNLAKYYNAVSYNGSQQWTHESALKDMFQNEHMSVWEHYSHRGQFWGINPSNEFNTNAYLDSLVAKGEYATRNEATEALAAMDVNPVMHCMESGNTPVPVDSTAFTNPPTNWNHWLFTPPPQVVLQ